MSKRVVCQKCVFRGASRTDPYGVVTEVDCLAPMRPGVQGETPVTVVTDFINPPGKCWVRMHSADAPEGWEEEV